MVNCNPVPTLMSYVYKSSSYQRTCDIIENVSRYKSVVEALQYIILTRPEIAFSINKLSQFLSCPRTQYWEACTRLLRYLKGTIHFGLQFYTYGAMQIKYFINSNCACDRDDRKSMVGFTIYLGPNLVSWSSKKQVVVSRSRTEANYRALSHAVSEVTLIHFLLAELHINLAIIPILWCNNQGAIALAYNSVYHEKTKHLELGIHSR